MTVRHARPCLPPESRRAIVPAVPTTSLAYRSAARALVPLVPAFLRDPRQRAAHAARLAAPAALAAWAGAHRDRRRPLAWFHAPSVGEGLQARAVIEAWRALHPDAQLLYTHYSPSAEGFAAAVPADWHGWMPYDRPADVRAALAGLDLTLLVFTKLDLWPELATQARRGGTRVAMVAATVSPESGRLRWPVRGLSRPGYAALDVAGAIGPDDADRLASLGTPRDRIVVTGDPRIDSVLGVVSRFREQDPIGDPSRRAMTLVAGSTWGPDDAVLLAAFAEVRARHPAARLIVAPHDPTPAHLAALEDAALRAGLPRPVRMSEPEAHDAPLMAIDRVGVLARMYREGSIAYVGGGWGDDGIHSVLEPAAWGLPVFIGPRDRGSADAALLAGVNALVRLPDDAAAAALAAQWSRWLDVPTMREAAGAAGLAALASAKGAAERSAAVL